MTMLTPDAAQRVIDNLVQHGGTTSDGYAIPPPTPRIDLAEELLRLNPQPGELIVVHLARPLSRDQKSHLMFWLEHHLKSYKTQLIVLDPGMKLRPGGAAANQEGG